MQPMKPMQPLSWFTLSILVSALITASHPGFAQTAGETVPQRLRELISLRLSVMDEVAEAKWNAGQPVEDLPREAVVLDQATATAAAQGVDEATARAFFQAQITASKIVQQRLFDLWKAKGQGPFANPPDLVKDIRPIISGLTGDLIGALKDLPGQEGDLCAVLRPLPDAFAEDEPAWAAAITPFCT